MNPEQCVFTGVHIASEPGRGRRLFTFAALDARRHLLALSPADLRGVLAYLGGQPMVLVAINAPQQLNRGLLAQRAAAEQLFPPESPARRLDMRLVEFELRQQGIPAPRTPADEKKCPRWIRQGLHLVTHLAELDFQPHPAEAAARQWLETCSEAAYQRLLEHPLFDGRSLEGRLQRQLILYNEELPVSEPLRFLEEITAHRLLKGLLPEEGLHSPAELSALVAALVAWLTVHAPSRVTALGVVEEGRIVLPV